MRDGLHTVADLMDIGKTMLGRRHVWPSVVSTMKQVMIEATFPSGTYLVTVHNPICTDDGDLAKALYGSFLPVPSNDMFPPPLGAVYEQENQPGAVVAVKGEAGTIKLSEGRKRIKLKVKSMGDRPIQVGHVSLGGYRSAHWSRRLVPTTTSSSRIRSYSSTASSPMDTGLTSQRAPRSGSDRKSVV